MENNARTGWEPEEQTVNTMNDFNEQTENDEDDTTPEAVDPIPQDDDIEEGSLEDEETEQDLDKNGSSTLNEKLEEDEPNEEEDNLDSEYKTSPQGAI